MAKILSIDDDATFRDILRENLTETGHTVIEATDAASGCAVAAMQKPDLIICDFLMPGVPGKSVFEELHANLETRNIPVIVMSGFAVEKIQSYVPQRLWSNIMSKPPEYDRLNARIDDLLQVKR